jgi:hypothetical protein
MQCGISRPGISSLCLAIQRKHYDRLRTHHRLANCFHGAAETLEEAGVLCLHQQQEPLGL